MRVHIVANLTARGLLKKTGRLRQVHDVARGRAELHETEDVRAVRGVVEEVVRAGADLVILAGGDGTFMSGVSALSQVVGGGPWPKVGLLPLGTVGTIARNLGEPGDPMALLDDWLRAPDRVHAIPRPTLRVTARFDGRPLEERVGFIVGTGLVARFFEVYEEGGAGGIPLAGKIVARVFVESFTGGPLAKRILTPMPCELWVDGVRHPTKGLSLLCAAVVRDLGLGMKVCYRAAEEPDRVHLVASSLPPRRLGPRAPYVILGRSIGGENHVDALVRSFEVRFPGSEPGPYVLDGDMLRARAFEVTPGPIVPVLGPRGT
ncbi:MAG: hypothetical protein IPM79_09045 [Polyangiaceae bacterium]|jgi:diacylglycerol kinase (ATP)|nr:hypothetical protein [Polyangiaceae bacterium]MBK8937774.1 hypothetical protein [Polyangiaceae bacterium]